MAGNYFLTRKSCRQFKAREIDEKELESILQKALKAPTCGNMQLYSVIITKDTDKKKKLAENHYCQPASITAPVILTICADFNRFTRWCNLNNADAGFDNFHSFITAMTDAVIIAQQIVTIAEMEGYGTCYLGTVTYNAAEISKLLELPDLVIPVASIAIGLPASEGEKTDRLPLNAILHQETYRNVSDSDIMDYYKILEENPDNEKFIKENQKENIAQVFSEVRYPRQLNEAISAKFLQLLKEKGF